MLGALARGARGHARIVPTWELSWLDTECELCGGCLSVCPTGAIYEKFEEGTSRPERAARADQTTCTFCGVGCQIDLNLDPQTKHIVKVTSKAEYLPNEGNLCVKGRFAFNFVHHPDRLTSRSSAARTASSTRRLGARARDRGRGPEEGHRRSTARSRSASSPRPG